MSFVHHSYTDIKSVGNEFNKTADEQQHLRGSGKKTASTEIFGFSVKTSSIQEWEEWVMLTILLP